MTLNEFKKNYFCKAIINDDNNLKITTELIRKKDGVTVDEEVDNIEAIDELIADSNSEKSTIHLSKEEIIEETKRSHLNLFALKFQVNDWYPLNSEENPNISNLFE